MDIGQLMRARAADIAHSYTSSRSRGAAEGKLIFRFPDRRKQKPDWMHSGTHCYPAYDGDGRGLGFLPL